MKHTLLFSLLSRILPFRRVVRTATINGIAYNLNIHARTAEVAGNRYFSGACEIPATVDYHGARYAVASIRKKAFWRCAGITELSLPSTLVSIGVAAFFDCKNLRSIVIPESVESIGLYAFNYCSSLTDIFYNSSRPAAVDDRIFDAGLYTRATLHIPESALNNTKETAPWRYFTNISVSQ